MSEGKKSRNFGGFLVARKRVNPYVSLCWSVKSSFCVNFDLHQSLVSKQVIVFMVGVVAVFIIRVVEKSTISWASFIQ